MILNYPQGSKKMLRTLLILSIVALTACGNSDQYEANLKYAEDAKKAGTPILIDNIGPSRPNSAGGVFGYSIAPAHVGGVKKFSIIE
jgi:hypothetical protein